MLYSVNMLRNFQRRNCCKEITENRRIIVRPHREVIISVVIRPFDLPSWLVAPLEIFIITLSRGVAFQLSIFSPLFLPLVRFREEHNFRNRGMCSISYSVTMAAKFKGRAIDVNLPEKNERGLRKLRLTPSARHHALAEITRRVFPNSWAS